jgi:hypothetical protein
MKPTVGFRPGRSVSGIPEIGGILHRLPSERYEMSPAAFRDVLVGVKYSIAGGKLLFTMTTCSHFHGIVGISPE